MVKPLYLGQMARGWRGERPRTLRASMLSLTLVCVVASGAAPAHAQSAPGAVVVDFDRIARFSPRARADIIKAIVEKWDLAQKGEINTPRRVQHFFATIATETGGLRLLEENLRYSAKRMLQIWPNRITTDQARALEDNPVALAQQVYNGRLGNRPPMDGWIYRGSGLIQLTGRANFRARGKELDLPLEDKPEMVRSTSTALASAVAYWSSRHINAAADRNDTREVRRLVNGGKIGLAEAQLWLARARRVFSAPGSEDAGSAAFDEVAAVRQLLIERQALVIDPTAAPEPGQVQAAIRTFQARRGIEQTGIVDEDTLYELTDPENFKRE